MASRIHPQFCARLALCALLGLAGCKSVDMGDITGSVAAPASNAPEDLRRYSDQLQKRYEADPGDKTIALNYARVLRARRLNDQAAAVLENVAIKNPNDRAVLSAYGKALADAGRLREARNVLANADSPDTPDWSVVNTRGSISDQMGDHVQARAHYEMALKLSPGEPSVLSNLGLSYALSHDLPHAEQVLRQAVASPRADMRERQNLAMVLALQGKFAEAEKISERDLPPEQARENIAAIRQMIQTPHWRDLQTPPQSKARRAQIEAGRDS